MSKPNAVLISSEVATDDGEVISWAGRPKDGSQPGKVIIVSTLFGELSDALKVKALADGDGWKRIDLDKEMSTTRVRISSTAQGVVIDASKVTDFRLEKWEDGSKHLRFTIHVSEKRDWQLLHDYLSGAPDGGSSIELQPLQRQLGDSESQPDAELPAEGGAGDVNSVATLASRAQMGEIKKGKRRAEPAVSENDLGVQVQ